MLSVHLSRITRNTDWHEAMGVAGLALKSIHRINQMIFLPQYPIKNYIFSVAAETTVYTWAWPQDFVWNYENNLVYKKNVE